jgi:lipoyl(octanoyl) transferase
MTRAPLAVISLGLVPYGRAHALQRELAERRIAGALDRDVLLLLSHEPTVTLGRGTRPESLPLAPEEIRRRGVSVVEVERGGDVTYHGPGQLVGYPILDLSRHRQDLHWYLRQVEAALIEGLADLGIGAGRKAGYTGVWTSDRKIASIGIHVRQWVTTHGFALNVVNDLAPFDLIVPCGISGVEMTSVARELGARPDAELEQRTARATVSGFARVFDLEPDAAGLADVLATGTGGAGRAYQAETFRDST